MPLAASPVPRPLAPEGSEHAGRTTLGNVPHPHGDHPGSQENSGFTNLGHGHDGHSHDGHSLDGHSHDGDSHDTHHHAPRRSVGPAVRPSLLRLSLAGRLAIAAGLLTPLWIAVFFVMGGP